uniref:Uncharacterized protein n=1 Tax=Arundo donax TaxID=35708 RepID=A0A0A9AEH4_ARUDO
MGYGARFLPDFFPLPYDLNTILEINLLSCSNSTVIVLFIFGYFPRDTCRTVPVKYRR